MSDFNIDDLLRNAERVLRSIGDNDEETSQQEVVEYSPEIFTGSIYDTQDEYELTTEDIIGANDADVDDSEILPFISSIELSENGNGHVIASITNINHSEIDLVGIAEPITENKIKEAPIADLDQIIQFALRQAEAIERSRTAVIDSSIEKEIIATTSDEELGNESLEYKDTNQDEGKTGEDKNYPDPLATLKVVADSWEKLRSIDVPRLIDTAIQISQAHADAVIAEIRKHRKDLDSAVTDALVSEDDMRSGFEITKISESESDHEPKNLVDIENAVDAPGSLPDGLLPIPSSQDEIVNKHPEGIIPLTEIDIYFSNSGIELSRYPKEFAKPITTARKRIEWFVDNLSIEKDKNIEALQDIEVLKEQPEENFWQIYKIGCLKLFDSEFGVPAINRKKTSQEIKQEKEDSEKAARDLLIQNALKRVKSKEEIEKLEDGKSRITSILQSVMNISTKSVEELIGKPHVSDAIPLIDSLSQKGSAADAEDSPRDEVVQVVTAKKASEHFDAYFAILKDGEKLAMGNGRYISNEQISAIAENENAIVIWAATQASLDAAVNKIINPNHGPSTRLSEEFPAKSLSENAQLNKFDQEVDRAIALMNNSLELHKKMQVPSAVIEKGKLPQNKEEVTETNTVGVPPLNSNEAVVNRTNVAQKWEVGLLPEIHELMNKIIDKFNANNDGKSDFAFYKVLKSELINNSHVLAVSKNLLDGQMKVYAITSSESKGVLVPQPSINKVAIAKFIAQGHITEMDVSDKKHPLKSKDRSSEVDQEYKRFSDSPSAGM